MLVDQGRGVDDPRSRGVGGKPDGLVGLLVVNIETEGGDNIADNSQIRAAGGVENEVESLGAASFEPILGRGKGSRGGGVHSNRLHANAELGGQSVNLGLGRDGEEH